MPDPIANMIELLKDENETLKQTLRLLEQQQEDDRLRIDRNSQAVTKLESRLQLTDGAGI
jgi:hypothetical protein